MDFTDPNKLQLTMFLKNAWRFHVRIINWPAGVPFVKCGVTTDNGYVAGYERIHDFTAGELAAICRSRIKALIAEVEGKTLREHELVLRWSHGMKVRFQSTCMMLASVDFGSICR